MYYDDVCSHLKNAFRAMKDKNGWILTDDDTMQVCRKVIADGVETWNLMEVNRVMFNAEKFSVTTAAIVPSRYTMDWIYEMAGRYYYSDREDFNGLTEQEVAEIMFEQGLDEHSISFTGDPRSVIAAYLKWLKEDLNG